VAVSRLVRQVQRDLNAGDFVEGGELVEHVRFHLEQIDQKYQCGCCDTVVKENVFHALMAAIRKADLVNFNRMEIYGW